VSISKGHRPVTFWVLMGVQDFLRLFGFALESNPPVNAIMAFTCLAPYDCSLCQEFFCAHSMVL